MKQTKTEDQPQISETPIEDRMGQHAKCWPLCFDLCLPDKCSELSCRHMRCNVVKALLARGVKSSWPPWAHLTVIDSAGGAPAQPANQPRGDATGACGTLLQPQPRRGRMHAEHPQPVLVANQVVRPRNRAWGERVVRDRGAAVQCVLQPQLEGLRRSGAGMTITPANPRFPTHGAQVARQARRPRRGHHSDGWPPWAGRR